MRAVRTNEPTTLQRGEQTKRGVSDDYDVAINLLGFSKAFMCLHVGEYVSSVFPFESDSLGGITETENDS